MATHTAADEGDPYAAEIAEYSQVQAADALFSRTSDNGPSLHVMLPTLGWLFSDESYLGTDPIGIFCFHRVAHFPKNVKCKYEVGTKTKGEQVWVNVKFYAANGKDVFAEYFANDQQGVVANAGMERAVGTGTWTHVFVSDNPAYASKPENGTTLKVIVGNIWWKAEFNIENYEYIKQQSANADKCRDLKNPGVAVKGRMVSGDEDILRDGVWVRWDFDHLVFYKDRVHSKDYIAYFMFDEDVDVSMMALGKVPKEIGGVTWAALAGEERKAAKQTFK